SPRTFTSYPSELVSWVSGSEFGLLVVTGNVDSGSLQHPCNSWTTTPISLRVSVIDAGLEVATVLPSHCDRGLNSRNYWSLDHRTLPYLLCQSRKDRFGTRASNRAPGRLCPSRKIVLCRAVKDGSRRKEDPLFRPYTSVSQCSTCDGGGRLMLSMRSAYAFNEVGLCFNEVG
ncbi:hypothetical protein Taro_025309, partial [Colocasia esculenta]|nr:hypothetical protein [Colocasia esculenta]